LFKITDLPVQGSCLAALLACNFAARARYFATVAGRRRGTRHLHPAAGGWLLKCKNAGSRATGKETGQCARNCSSPWV